MRYICILGIALLICMVLKKVSANTEKTDKGFAYCCSSYNRHSICRYPICTYNYLGSRAGCCNYCSDCL